MIKTDIFTYACTIFLGSTLLIGCGTDSDNSQNPMQDESPEPNMRTESINPSTELADGEEVDGEVTGANIGGLEMTNTQNIVENLQSNPNLTTIASLVNKARLVNKLNNAGPYTIFAPSNEAFEKLPGDSFEDLMKPENRQRLMDILNNHIVMGKLKIADLKEGSLLKTVGGEELKVSKSGNNILVNGAKVEKIDGESQNGVIHVLDKVLVQAD